ncbi:MAG: IS66 family transposase [Planctomycetales bacterium]
MTLITSHIVEAYSVCPRKAFLLQRGEPSGNPHQYGRIIEEQEAANRQKFQASQAEAVVATDDNGLVDLMAAHRVILDALVVADDLEARCDALKRRKVTTDRQENGYEPVKVLGTHCATKPQILGLAYLGHVLGHVLPRPPATGMVMLAGGQARRIKLTGRYKEVRSVVAALRRWAGEAVPEAPRVILNKHCPCCPFRDNCRPLAEAEDSLSLLDRMTPKLIRQYHDKGISTVHQLSYLFRPRRSRKKGKRPVRHSFKLQALAIRTGKTYVEHLPDLSRHPIELFLDMEGVPDQNSYYLIGVLVCVGEESRYHAFWADGREDEESMWKRFLDHVALFPEAPIYHYGSYERKAFTTLARRHHTGGDLLNRLVNVASFVFGKVYFPVHSNGLKVLGKFVGATWSNSEASGLMSLVWRHLWETTGDNQHKAALLEYNREDCAAVLLLLVRLTQIKETAGSEPAVDFAHRPKQTATESGRAIHEQFERILHTAQEDGQRRSVRVRAGTASAEDQPKKRGAPKGHQAFQRIAPSRVSRTVRLAPKRKCPRGHGELVLNGQGQAEQTVVDLVFTRNGCRKTVTRYAGKKGWCPKCNRHYPPPFLNKMCRHQFGHNFQVWTVYQRIILRLPYRIITQVSEHLFGVGFSMGTVVRFLQYQADYYADTEAAALAAIRKSGFVHVDETRINIQGADHYAWVFTDGQHVVFRMTETREADIVREVLAGYQGVLVSDFYPGYDGVPCRQQKCLVHLIRDINDDLWKAPFDREFETFALTLRDLLVPIMTAVDRYGLKTWHLRKFEKDVEKFYARQVVDREYVSELAVKYQKRFQRYREGLFTFLGEDGIPWNNNMAERAIRQLAVQRKISGTFFKRVAPQYLLLLSIAQTCRFQGKSFLKFLLSKTKDVDEFRRSRAIKYSSPVGQAIVSPVVTDE